MNISEAPKSLILGGVKDSEATRIGGWGPPVGLFLGIALFKAAPFLINFFNHDREPDSQILKSTFHLIADQPNSASNPAETALGHSEQPLQFQPN